MFNINTDERVLGYLGRALSLELSAVQLYSTQSMLVATWGLTDVADKFENELISLYDDATRYCSSISDYDNRLFFEALLNEEKEHAVDLTKWMQELKQTSTKM